jgi:hypothetical protein
LSFPAIAAQIGCSHQIAFKAYRKALKAIVHPAAGPTLELATEGCYIARHVKAMPYWMIRGVDPELLKVEGNDGPDDERVVRHWPD